MTLSRKSILGDLLERLTRPCLIGPPTVPARKAHGYRLLTAALVAPRTPGKKRTL